MYNRVEKSAWMLEGRVRAPMLTRREQAMDVVALLLLLGLAAWATGHLIIR
jgi:hypothetical protein